MSVRSFLQMSWLIGALRSHALVFLRKCNSWGPIVSIVWYLKGGVQIFLSNILIPVRIVTLKGLIIDQGSSSKPQNVKRQEATPSCQHTWLMDCVGMSSQLWALRVKPEWMESWPLKLPPSGQESYWANKYLMGNKYQKTGQAVMCGNDIRACYLHLLQKAPSASLSW